MGTASTAAPATLPFLRTVAPTYRAAAPAAMLQRLPQLAIKALPGKPPANL
jgi:hypothetical protein